MSENIRFLREEAIIKKAFFAKRFRETPPIRDVKVIWHFGDSGSGKSYTYVSLCEKYGEENVYLMTDYSNRGVGGFDNYCGEPILFLDEMKGGCLPYEFLLSILQGYRSQLHCRFSNAYMLWSEVHITSIFTPEELYSITVKEELQGTDTVNQLLRRITGFIYHYIDNGKFKTFEISASEYSNYVDINKHLKSNLIKQRS